MDEPQLNPCQAAGHLFELYGALPSSNGQQMYVLCECGAQRVVANKVYEAAGIIERWRNDLITNKPVPPLEDVLKERLYD